MRWLKWITLYPRPATLRYTRINYPAQRRDGHTVKCKTPISRRSEYVPFPPCNEQASQPCFSSVLTRTSQPFFWLTKTITGPELVGSSSWNNDLCRRIILSLIHPMTTKWHTNLYRWSLVRAQQFDKSNRLGWLCYYTKWIKNSTIF